MDIFPELVFLLSYILSSSLLFFFAQTDFGLFLIIVSLNFFSAVSSSLVDSSTADLCFPLLFLLFRQWNPLLKLPKMLLQTCQEVLKLVKT